MTEMSVAENIVSGEVLTFSEVQRLDELEQVVETGLTVFVQVGNALLEIRDSRLYRQQFQTFEAYCRERWGMVQRHANRLIAAAETVGILGPMGPTPTTERQARPLTRLEPEVQREVWQAVTDTTPADQMTAKIVEEQAKAAELLNEAVKAVKEELKPEPATAQQQFLPEPAKIKDPLVLAVTEKVKAGAMTVLEAAKEIRQAKTEQRREERLEKIIEISQGNAELKTDIRYPVLYADPPWRYEHAESESRMIENQYPTMALDEICALPVADLVTPDAILFLWATSPKLAESMRVIESWGFTYRTCAVWDKQKIGMGYYFRQRHELLLVATRGSIPTPSPENRAASVIVEPREEHSAKPAKFAELIESMYPSLPRIELFCRAPRAGWAAWGNQSC